MTCERTALVRDGGFSTRAEDGNLYICLLYTSDAADEL